jgi:lactobin A/cerein 7B family class IIb bacteriocin
MNLENLGLVELNAQEVQEVDGGIFGIDDAFYAAAALFIAGVTVIYSAGYAVGTAVAHYQNNHK